MSSNLRVNNILPSVGTNVAIGTAGGSVTLTGTTSGTFNSSGIATFSSGIVVSAGSTAAPSISPSGDSNTGIFFPAPDTVAIGEGGVEALRVNSSGGVQIANGNLIFSTAGTGIDFSATANSSGTMTSELLADYEEGTWTPTLTANANCSALSLNGAAWYIKIGKLVTYSLNVNITVTTTATKTVFIMSLPFAQSSILDRQGGSAILEGPGGGYPIAAGGIGDASPGSSDAFVAWGSSAINFTGSSTAYLTGSFKAD